MVVTMSTPKGAVSATIAADSSLTLDTKGLLSNDTTKQFLNLLTAIINFVSENNITNISVTL
jgi:hypothetical protein